MVLRWHLRPISAIPFLSLNLAGIVALASLLSEYLETRSWEAAFSAWIYRRWEAVLVLIGVTTVFGTGLWALEKALAKKMKE